MNGFNVFVYNFNKEDIDFVSANLEQGMGMEIIDDMSAFIGEYYFLGLIKQEGEDENYFSEIENYLNECNQTSETIVVIGKLKSVPQGNATRYIKILHNMEEVKQNWKDILELAKENYYKYKQ